MYGFGPPKKEDVVRWRARIVLTRRAHMGCPDPAVSAMAKAVMFVGRTRRVSELVSCEVVKRWSVYSLHGKNG